MKLEDIRVIAVCGAGSMGNGIAQVIAQQGYEVLLVDIKQEILDSALGRIKSSLQKLKERGKVTEDEARASLSRIRTMTSVEKAAEKADFIIEAIPEALEMKKELLRKLDAASRAEAILKSNTSTPSITGLGSVTKLPEKFTGMHFMNPVPLMSLVEIVKGLLTTQETITVTKDLATKLGKESVVVADSPGFTTSRLGIALFLEASRMLEEGQAAVDGIDKAMRLGYSHRMGPFETCDLVGLDARLNNINALYESTQDPAWKPPQLLKKLVSAGFLGKKPNSKGGYYKYFGLET